MRAFPEQRTRDPSNLHFCKELVYSLLGTSSTGSGCSGFLTLGMECKQSKSVVRQLRGLPRPARVHILHQFVDHIDVRPLLRILVPAISDQMQHRRIHVFVGFIETRAERDTASSFHHENYFWITRIRMFHSCSSNHPVPLSCSQYSTRSSGRPTLNRLLRSYRYLLAASPTRVLLEELREQCEASLKFFKLITSLSFCLPSSDGFSTPCMKESPYAPILTCHLSLI